MRIWYGFGFGYGCGSDLDPDSYRDTGKTCLGGGMHCASALAPNARHTETCSRMVTITLLGPISVILLLIDLVAHTVSLSIIDSSLI